MIICIGDALKVMVTTEKAIDPNENNEDFVYRTRKNGLNIHFFKDILCVLTKNKLLNNI